MLFVIEVKFLPNDKFTRSKFCHFCFLCQPIEVITPTTINQRSTWFSPNKLNSAKWSTCLLFLSVLLPKPTHIYSCVLWIYEFPLTNAWNSASIAFDCLPSINCCPAFFHSHLMFYRPRLTNNEHKDCSHTKALLKALLAVVTVVTAEAFFLKSSLLTLIKFSLFTLNI